MSRRRDCALCGEAVAEIVFLGLPLCNLCNKLHRTIPSILREGLDYRQILVQSLK